MSEKHTDEKLELTTPPYKALFLKTFGNDGRLPYKIKCVALGVIMWIFGFFHAYVMNVLDLYMKDFIFFTLSILMGIAFAMVIHVCNQTDTTIRELNTIFQESEKDFQKFIHKWNRQSPIFYYLSVAVFTMASMITFVLAFFPATYTYTDPALWIRVLVENVTANYPTYLYVSFIAIVIGIVLGVSFNKIIYCVRVIDDYGKDFISYKKIDLRRAIIPEELTSLARLAIKIDLVIAVPTTVGALLFFNGLLNLRIMNLTILAYLIVSMFLLVFFSIYPLRHLHKELAEAKRELMKELNDELLQSDMQHDRLTQIPFFHSVLVLHDKVKAMSTWGINTGLLIKFFMTGFLPLVLGALLQIWFQLLLFP